MVSNVDHDALVADQSLKDAFVDEVKTVLAASVDVTKNDVEVTLTKGSVVVLARILETAAKFAEASAFLDDDDVMASLQGNMTTAFESIADLSTVTSGSLSVTIRTATHQPPTPAPTMAPSPAVTYAPTPAPNSTDDGTTKESDADGSITGSLSHVIGMVTVVAAAVSTFML